MFKRTNLGEDEGGYRLNFKDKKKLRKVRDFFEDN